MATRPAAKHFGPNEGRSFKVGRFDVSFKAGTRDGSGYAIAELTIPPGLGPSPHHHPFEESIYVLEGDFELHGADGARHRGLLIVGHLQSESFLEEMSVAMAKTPRDEELIAAIFARHGIIEEG